MFACMLIAQQRPSPEARDGPLVVAGLRLGRQPAATQRHNLV